MVLQSDNHAISYEPVSSLLVKTIISAFTILTAFSIRDSIIQTITLFTPGDASKKLVFTLLTTFTFLFLTVLMAFFWQDQT